MLRNDFGVDLSIEGGFGQSAKDPICLATSQAQDASLTQLKIARFIYGAMGAYWRVIAREYVTSEPVKLEKLTFEIKFTEGLNVVTEQRNLYFDLSAVALKDSDQLPPISISVPPPVDVSLPWQIGYFHFDNLIDNETDRPGLGFSAAYSAPHTKMTVYLYDKGISNLINANPVAAAKTEYQQALHDYKTMFPQAQLVHEYEESQLHVSLFECEAAFAAVLVATSRGLFFKLRLTIEGPHEQFRRDSAWESIGTFTQMLRQRNLNA